MMPYTYDYHADADILEVFFADEPATASVHLTPDIIVHFRAEDSRAISLIFNNFSHLIRSDEYGQRAFRLDVEHWPEPLRDVVLNILTFPPTSEWLMVRSYHPPHEQPIPLAMIQPVPVEVV